MRYLIILLIGLFVVSCGPKEGNGGGDSASTPEPSMSKNQYHSRLVESESDLPSCAPEAEGWLIYVKSQSIFKTCSIGQWVDVDIKGEDGANGVDGKDGSDGVGGEKITGYYNLNDENQENLCTRYGNETCQFGGASVVYWSDGSVQFGGSFVYSVQYDIGDGNFDTDIVHISRDPFFCYKANDWCSLRLMSISRGVDDTAYLAILVYDVLLNEFKIVYDTNENEKYDADDPVILLPTLNSIYIGD